MEETNKPRLYFFIKAPIIIVAIIVFVSDYYELVEYYDILGNNGGILEYLKIAFNTSILRTSFIMLVPLIGVFFNKKIGWLLLLSFYYFWVILFIYLVASIELDRSGTRVIAFGAIITSIFFVGIMNARENSKSVYGINPKEQLKMNFAAFLIASIQILFIVFLNSNQT